MIQELREYSNSIFFKILLGIIAITFVLSFGVGGFFGDRKEVIATVNDNEILLREYRGHTRTAFRHCVSSLGRALIKLPNRLIFVSKYLNSSLIVICCCPKPLR